MDGKKLVEITEYLDETCESVKTEKSNLHFHTIVEHFDDYVVAEIYGGINGRGVWTEYLEDLKNLLAEIGKKHRCWIVNLNNDCLDDVFDVRIGVRL